MSTTTGSPSSGDKLGGQTEVPPGGWRDRMRSKPGIGHFYRVGVFVAGLACIAAGAALLVLPGPLTIPPVLLGLYLWSTEFVWAKRFFDPFKVKADQAWQHAKQRPVSSTIVTVGGLVLAGVAFWAFSHYHVIDRLRDFVGL